MAAFNHESIGFWITRRAELTPGKIAVDFEDQKITYGELNERSNLAAEDLVSQGVEKGDRVAVLSENRPEYLETFFACAKLGAVIVPISWRLSEPEMAWQIQDSEPKVLVSSTDWSEAASRIFSGQQHSLASRHRISTSSRKRTEEPRDPSSFDDPLMILYTSGTTGRPKGAVLTHGNFFWANLNMIINSDISHDEVSLMFLPMFHIGGWNVNTLSVLWKGGTVVLEKEFDPSRVIDLIPKKQVTLLMGVPSTYLFMSQQLNFDSADFSSLRLMIVGGAPMPASLLETYAARGINIIQGYGLTELAPNALILPTEDASRKIGSAGKPYFFADTRLMDDKARFIKGPGTGEIVAAGPIVMKEYWRRADATNETVIEGFLHTGDIGRVDEEGFFYVVDRKKDMIISGGENIYPAEIENVIYELDAVAECAVIGIPDDKWGESAHAIVLRKDGRKLESDELLEHCKARLGKFKVPRSVEFRDTPLPRTPAGKVRKQDLRTPFWEGREKKI